MFLFRPFQFLLLDPSFRFCFFVRIVGPLEANFLDEEDC